MWEAKQVIKLDDIVAEISIDIFCATNILIIIFLLRIDGIVALIRSAVLRCDYV